jgi:CheY-like chemotaxis protein
VLPFAPQRKSLAILIVEEDAALRDALRRMLEADGHRVVGACGGREAPAAIHGAAYDLLISDVLFPGVRTLEAVVERGRAGGPLPIIGLSRFARILPDYYLSLTAKLGVRVILTKPVDRAQLAEALVEALAGEAGGRPGGRPRACAAVA